VIRTDAQADKKLCSGTGDPLEIFTARTSCLLWNRNQRINL